MSQSSTLKIDPILYHLGLTAGFTELHPCREDARWSVPNSETDAGTEIETILFLYGMIRTLKPRRVVETGCNVGVTTAILARAVEENGFGEVWACDIEEGLVAVARERCAKVPVKLFVSDGAEFVKATRPDFAFLDSSYEGRRGEIAALPEGCTAIVHDTTLETSLADAVRAKGGLVFPGPRGFGVIRT